MTDGVSVLVMEIAWSRRRLSASALCSPPYKLRWLRSAKTLRLVSFCQNLFRRASPAAKSQKEIGRSRSPLSRRLLKAPSTMNRDNSFHRPRGIPPSRKLSLMENISESAAPSPAHVRNWTIASVLEWVLARRLRRQSRLSLSCQERHLACQERRE